MKTWSELLWGRESRFIYLFTAALLLLLTCLGAREIWTQEHRWADIVAGMFYRHDFLHPFLGEKDYYDKPLLSYWLIAGLSYISSQLSTWTLRLPSVFAGLLSIWAIYRLGTKIENKRLGLLAGWMLLTTFYFIFWAKTSSADMLNLAGSLFAVSWYFDKREQPSFINYTIFFIILALTALCKGLIGIVVPMIVIFPDLVRQNHWKTHLHPRFFLAMIPGLILYILPFWASSHFGGENYNESGLYLVYRENVLRYFQPFDHKGPIYTYFIFLPIYLCAWAAFFIPALWSVKSRWKTMSANTQWVCWAVLLLFVFLTLSGSRRNYYVLPLVPFAILLTAQWILEGVDTLKNRTAGMIAIISFVVLFAVFDVVQPLYYAQGGMKVFAQDVQSDISQIRPLGAWNYVLLDAESKVRFYLQLAPNVKDYPVTGARDHQTEASLKAAWPVLTSADGQTIYITRKQYEPIVQKLLPGYRVIEAKRTLGERIIGKENKNAPVAFVPKGMVG